MTEKYISFRKAGEMLGVSEKTVLNYVSTGELTAEGERGKRKVLLSSVTSRLQEFENKRENSLERLPLISLKLDLVDLLGDNALPVSLAYMYEERLADIVVLPADQQRAELLKIVQEAKRL